MAEIGDYCANSKSYVAKVTGLFARAKRPSWQRIKIHRAYTVDELARTLEVAKGTVRRWLKLGLPALSDRKPTLIIGGDAYDFHKGRKRIRQRCQLHECYCVKCRCPRRPAGNMAEYIPLGSASGNLRAICPVCTRLMHKRVSIHSLLALREELDIAVPEEVERLGDCFATSQNDDLNREALPYA